MASSDYISREALLSATEGYDWQAGLKTVLKRIHAADSIEELQQQVEHYHGCMNDRFEAAQEYKAQIPRWIPVDERKPKTDDLVIVAIHDDSGDTPYDVTNVGFYLDVFPLGIWVVENERCNYVTHWMRLPEPPKEE